LVVRQIMRGLRESALAEQSLSNHISHAMPSASPLNR
jgi:hypothetical protein